MEFYLFDRTTQIIHFEDLSILSKGEKIQNSSTAVMSQNEVFVLQIAALSSADDEILSVNAVGNGVTLSCINTDVTDKFANEKKQTVNIKANNILPLFFTVEAEKTGSRSVIVDFQVNCVSGTYTFSIVLKINDLRVYNNGYNDLWRLSRLKWLNSTLAQDDTLVKPFVKPEIKDNVVKILGREILLNSNGLPKQVNSFFDEGIQIKDSAQKSLFAKPCDFIIGSDALICSDFEYHAFNNRIETVAISNNEQYNAKVKSVLRYDGQLEYSVAINPIADFIADSVSLNFYINKNCADLMHGLGHRASAAENLNFKWDVDKQQDCIFTGSVNCGMRVKFKAENYKRPLINIFYKNLPLVVPTTTWDNNSLGSINVSVEKEFVKLTAETGSIKFEKGILKSFNFELHITPFKPLDYKKLFGVRYSHSNALKNEYKEIDNAAKNGLNYVTFHQGNMIMPYINYPFYETDRLKKAVQYASSKNIGIKLYYTEREHSNHMAETFVYKALGDEIILRKQGVSHSWQKEKPKWLVDNFGEDIIPGWFVKYKKGKYKGEHDFSFIVRPDTRLDNYYIEGLNWLLENIGIKGIYIDDTSLDRTTIERAKKLLDKKNGLIDMHMWNHEEPRAGDVSCLNLYCELLPFLDSIWLGEGFFYKKYTPEYMLCEVSGIPYGVGGQMLQDGGDLYEGMLYAMNNRYGWGVKNAVDLYAVWDEFGIESSEMLGYWHSKNPVVTNNKNVLTTVYLKNDKALLCVYNFSKNKEKFDFCINADLLKFKIGKAKKIKLGSHLKKSVNIESSFALGGRQGAMYLLSV